MNLTESWWHNATIYQVYPRSFADSNGDGIGDIQGIISKLDYIASLGVDAIWLSPFFKSPMVDYGYDVSDYRDVDPMFGTLEDFDELIDAAHSRGLKIIIDQILSHTSDQHSWFKESRKSRDNAKSDWYVWADSKPDGNPPNNWVSVFGGSSWKWDTVRRQYYLHNFVVEQPDLNLHNPAVQDQLISDLKFWLDRGVDGFRMDAINFCFHHQSLSDNPAKYERLEDYGDLPPVNQYDYQQHLNDKTQPENLVFLQRIRELLDQYPDTMAVGEIGDDNMVDVMTAYTTENRLHCAYSFELLTESCDAPFIRDIVQRSDSLIHEGWACWSTSNHDVPRVMTRWNHGDLTPEQKRERAKLFWLMQFALRGNCCIYQGEELGLEEVELEFHELKDPYGINLWPEFKGRDGCRTPMPWNATKPHAGFTEGEPWLPVRSQHAMLSVDVCEADSSSLLHDFRALNQWKKSHPELAMAGLEMLDDTGELLVFYRVTAGSRLLCILNLAHEEQRFELVDDIVTDITPSNLAHKREGGVVILPVGGAAVYKVA